MKGQSIGWSAACPSGDQRLRRLILLIIRPFDNSPRRVATASNPNQQNDGRQSNQKVDDSALVMESPSQETPIYARCQHCKDKYPKSVLSDGERDCYCDH